MVCPPANQPNRGPSGPQKGAPHKYNPLAPIADQTGGFWEDLPQGVVQGPGHQRQHGPGGY